jgi:integrase
MPTLKQFVDGDYGEWVKAHHKSSVKTMHRLESVLHAFGNTKLDRLTTWNIEKWRAKRLKAGRKPATVNRDVDTLKAALSKAVEWKLIDRHPVADVRRVKAEEAGRVRYLDQAEEQRLRDALSARDRRLQSRRASANAWRQQRGYEAKSDLSGAADHLTPMVLLAMNTGLRRGELFLLSWKNLNLSTAMLTVQASTAKSSRTRHVPLNTEALSVLRAWKTAQADTSGLVFPGKDGGPFDNINRSWNAVRAAAELDDFTFHDLRHHFASRLVMAGVDLNTVRELLGHSDIKMTLRYAHLAPEHKAAAVARLLEN